MPHSLALLVLKGAHERRLLERNSHDLRPLGVVAERIAVSDFKSLDPPMCRTEERQAPQQRLVVFEILVEIDSVLDGGAEHLPQIIQGDVDRRDIIVDIGLQPCLGVEGQRDLFDMHQKVYGFFGIGLLRWADPPVQPDLPDTGRDALGLEALLD